jgi:16S rRNA (guanine527-N7)-methyltransferase
MLNPEQTRLLREGAGSLGLKLSEATLARFSIYLEELQRWSKIADLVSQEDLESIIRKHLLDSLAVFLLIPQQSRLLDLGSGAGFPGLALAIVDPSLAVVLIEARRKRANFLKEAIRKTQVTNVKVYEGRVEALAKDKSFHETFDVVITRATWNISTFLQLARPFAKESGLALCMKGPRIEKELTSPEKFPLLWGFCLKNRHKYTLPFGKEQREVIIFSKCSSKA